MSLASPAVQQADAISFTRKEAAVSSAKEQEIRRGELTGREEDGEEEEEKKNR